MATLQALPAGVPLWQFDRAGSPTMTAQEWWILHWANPASPNYLPSGVIPLHPHRVIVAPTDNLQTVVDNSEDNTTFVLPPGPTPAFDGVLTLVGRNGMHFVSSDSANRSVLRWHTITSHPAVGPDPATPWQLFVPPGVTDKYIYNNLVAKVINATRDGTISVPAQDPTVIYRFLNQPRDYIFRDIDFIGDPAHPSYSVSHQHAEYQPVELLSVRDILYEGCTWSAFNLADKDGNWPGDTTATGMMGPHPALHTAHGGVDGLVIRNCTINAARSGASGDNRWYAPIYFDGCFNSAVVNCTLSGYRNYVFLTLTNNDFRMDWNHDGIYELTGAGIYEQRYTQYVALSGNTATTNTGECFWSNRGARHVIVENNTFSPSGPQKQFAEMACDTITSDVWITNNTIATASAVGTSGRGVVHVLSGSAQSSEYHIVNNHITGGGTAPNGWLTEATPGTSFTNTIISGNTP